MISARPTTAALLTCLALTGALCGCSTMNGLLQRGASQRQYATRREQTDTGHALIDALAQMQVDSASTHADLVASAKAAADTEPSIANRLRYAAYLALPRQPAADPIAARKLLAELVAQPEMLRPIERVLASLLLEAVDDRLVLQSESNRLRQDLASREKERLAALPPKRSATDAEEISRLKRALEDAQRKLDAVIQVERSMLGRDISPKP